MSFPTSAGKSIGNVSSGRWSGLAIERFFWKKPNCLSLANDDRRGVKILLVTKDEKWRD